MIVYSANKGLFVQDVKTGVIATKILKLIRERSLNAGQDRVFESWHNSMKFMWDAVDERSIDDEVQIAIEYNIQETFAVGKLAKHQNGQLVPTSEELDIPIPAIFD